MKVYVAVKTGFYGSIKDAGAEFLAPDNFKSSWAIPKADAKAIEEATAPGFLDGTVAEVVAQVPALSDAELRRYLDAEVSGKMRKGIVARLEDEIANRALNPPTDDLLS